jgi:hypothetical protein
VEIICPTILAMNLTLKSTIPQLYFSIKLARQSLRNEIGSQLCQLTYNETQDFHVFCDVSEIGFGGHLTTGSEDEPVEIYCSWSREEQAQSSTWRELEAGPYNWSRYLNSQSSISQSSQSDFLLRLSALSFASLGIHTMLSLIECVMQSSSREYL